MSLLRPRHSSSRRNLALGRVALALAISGSFVPAHAADRLWFGGNGDWAVDGNWSPSGVPGNADRAIVNAGTANLSFAQVVGALTQGGGTIAGAGLTVLGDVLWTAGDQAGPGASQFDGNVTMTGDGTRSLSGARTMSTAAVTTWSGNSSAGGNAINMNGAATINNAGTWNDVNAFDSSIGSAGTGATAFNNTGTYNKAGHSTTTVTAAFTNSGTLNVHAGGIMHVDHSDFANSGLIQGDGTIRTAASGELVNSGVIAPGMSAGTLTADGALRMTPDGEIRIELASRTEFDRLAITGDVTFDGTLAILPLGYVPVLGDSFTLITFGERLNASEFAQVTWSGFGPGVVFNAVYNPNDVTLTVAAIPEPSTYVLSLVGLGLVAAMVRRRRAALGR